MIAYSLFFSYIQTNKMKKKKYNKQEDRGYVMLKLIRVSQYVCGTYTSWSSM